MHKFRKYLTFEFEDFIENDQFRNWVVFPTKGYNDFWEEFLEVYPDKKGAVDEAREFLLGTRNYFQTNDISERDLQIGLGRVLEKASSGKPESKPQLRTHAHYQWAAVAASVAMVVGLFGWYIFNVNNGLTTYTTDFGEWKTVELPDGSKVELNANSELILAEDWFDGVTRQVWLQGEAFFTVTKKPSTNTKFQVITDDLTIEVLGTEFNVQDRGNQTEVYLQEGKIKLDMGVAKEDLNPGDFVSFSSEKNRVISRKQMISEEYTSWKEGVLQLNNTTILEILREIEEIYGVEMMVSNKAMLSEKRTIGVPMKNLEIVIPILETTLDVEIRKVGNKLFVK